jgi:mannose-6-phosphate isomerase-like protein (cupin superfamily)
VGTTAGQGFELVLSSLKSMKQSILGTLSVNPFDCEPASALESFRMNQTQPCQRLTVAGALAQLPGPDGQRFATIFEHGSLLVEIYTPRGTDPQQPHTRDEAYFVASGSGDYVCGETRTAFGPTDFLFAAAGVSHRFENFTDELVVWVIFYGPEGGESVKP